MRPKQAAACALVVATCLGCGSGSGGSKAQSAAESFPLDAAGAPTPAAAPAGFVPAYAVNGTVSVKVGKYPSAVAVNARTNKVYIANNKSNTVTVIDGATNKTTTVVAGEQPVAVAVNQVTNKIYVLNQKGKLVKGTVDPNGTGSVTVIDGATNKTSQVPVGQEPGALAVNETTNKVYVANAASNDVTVIDGATNKTTTVGLTNDADAGKSTGVVLAPQDVRVNAVTDKIYVTGSQNNTLAVIDGKTNAFTILATEGGTEQNPSGLTPTGMALDTTRNKIYTANLTSNDVTVMDGATNALTPIPLVDVQDPYTIAFNPTTNKVYVANLTSKSVTVIDGATNKAVTIGDLPGKPHDIVVNPVTNKVYFPLFITYRGSLVGDDKQITGLVGELDGATNTVTFAIAGITPYAIAVNPTTNRVYVVNQDGNTVTVFSAGGRKAQ